MGSVAVAGIGLDKPGLVAGITSVIAKAGGNIIDMEQSVKHGVFTIVLLVDTRNLGMSVEELENKLESVEHGLGLKIVVKGVGE